MVFQNLIVLGIIPGTNIQINFQLWLGVTLTLFSVWQFRRLMHSKLLAAILMISALHRNNSLGIYDITL